MSENILNPILEKERDAVLSDEEYAALPTLKGADPKLLAEAIAEVLEARRGHDVKVIFVEDKTEIAEYFVLCTGNSSTQVKALIGEVEHKIALRGVEPHHVLVAFLFLLVYVRTLFVFLLVFVFLYAIFLHSLYAIIHHRERLLFDVGVDNFLVVF